MPWVRNGMNRVPTLLVCGTQEARFQPRRRFAEQTWPHLEVVEVAAGHAANLEAPAAFNQAAIAFFGPRRTSAPKVS